MFLRIILLAGCLCAPQLRAGGIYWTDRGASQLKRMNFDGSNLQTNVLSGAVTTPGTNIRGIAVNNSANALFWADNGADRLLRANLDGSASTILVTIAGGNSFPADIRLYPPLKQLYWCDQLRNRIQRSGIDGTLVTDIITNAAASGPYFMDLDPGAAKIYWGDFSGGSIYRASLDGTARETLLTGNNSTRGVRVDPGAGLLYWINRDDKKVHRCPLAAFAGGTIPLTHPAVQTLYTNLDTPHGLALDPVARKLYWADTGTNPGNGNGGQSICRGDIDGSTPLEILATGSEPWDVDLDLRCTNYTEWVQRCFRRDASAEQTAPDADPDGDLIPNAVEYAFDLSPLHADRSQLPAGTVITTQPSVESFPALEYRRRGGTTDLAYHVQVSTNLHQWTGGTSAPATIDISTTALADGLEHAVTRSTVSLPPGSQQFLRVRATLSR